MLKSEVQGLREGQSTSLRYQRAEPLSTELGLCRAIRVRQPSRPSGSETGAINLCPMRAGEPTAGLGLANAAQHHGRSFENADDQHPVLGFPRSFERLAERRKRCGPIPQPVLGHRQADVKKPRLVVTQELRSLLALLFHSAFPLLEHLHI